MPKRTDPRLENKLKLIEKERLMRCQYIGNELEGMEGFFTEELQSSSPYNGSKGHYTLTIPIPGTNYSEIPITIEIT